jgi:hypothetical protein
MSASGPAALVTGASSGIGEVFARRLSLKGYRLILVARRTERLNKLEAEIGNADFLGADLALEADLDRVARRISEEPRLEFLVNNAGFGLPASGFAEAAPEDLDRMHRLHILAIERLTRAALEGMIPRRKGTIINVSSVAGFLSTPYNLSYCATKAWINRFTEALWLELRCMRSEVRVQALCPGFTRTEFHRGAGMERRLVPGSFWMSPEAVVDASLRGLERNRWVVVPGWRYRLFLSLLRRLPESLSHRAAMRYGRSLRPPEGPVTR